MRYVYSLIDLQKKLFRNHHVIKVKGLFLIAGKSRTQLEGIQETGDYGKRNGCPKVFMIGSQGM